MIADRHKWWRWIGEESLSGGTIGLHEGGGTFPCGQRRPSEHSIMRWIGFDWDQVGREHMVARITRPQERRADVVAQHAGGHGGAGRRALGRDPAPEVPRARRHMADRRPERRGGRHRQQPQPRPRSAQRRTRHGRPRGGARPGRPRRQGLGAQPLDRQHRDGLGLQRAAVRPDQAVDRRRGDGGAVTAGRGDHPGLDDRPAGRWRRGGVRRDQPSGRPGAGRGVAAGRRAAPQPAQQPEPGSRRARAPIGNLRAHGDRDRSGDRVSPTSSNGPSTTCCRRRTAACPNR